MKLTIKIDDELAQENVKRLWMNKVNVSQVVNKMLADIRFDFRYDFEPVVIQETGYKL